MSFGLLNYIFPLLPLLRPLFPIGHPHLPQITPHIVFLSYSWPSLQSCCIRFPFVCSLSHSFISHSFYMPQPAQSFEFYVSYYISLLLPFSSSSFVLSLHSPLAVCVGPNILLNIFLSNINNFCLMFSVKTQHSDPYTTTGLIRALYNFMLVFLDISLLWNIFWFAKEARLPAAVLSFISS